MQNVWVLASLWVGLALVATLLAIWFKILHEVSRVAEQALKNARRTREEGVPAVETALEKLRQLEGEIVKLDDVALLSSRQLS